MRTSLINIRLYGSRESRESAISILENHIYVRRADVSENKTVVRLLLSSAISEGEIIELIHNCGLFGIQIK